jgi:hypothetical protein
LAKTMQTRRRGLLLFLPMLGNVENCNDAHHLLLGINRIYNYIGQSEHQKFARSPYPAAVTYVRPHTEPVNGIPNPGDNFRCCPPIAIIDVVENIFDIDPRVAAMPNDTLERG